MYISSTGGAPLKNSTDPIFRASWIAQKVKLAKTQYMDGINIDIEQEANCLSPEYYALTTLVKETTDSFHREIKGSQVKVHLLFFFWQLLFFLPKCIYEGVTNRISVLLSRKELHIYPKSIFWKF